MYPLVLTKGMLIGFLIASIIGPIGILCIPRSINEGFLAGLATGLGVALSDSVFAALAIFGLTVVSRFLFHNASILGLVGGLFLIFNAGKTLLKSHSFSCSTVALSGVKLVSIFFLAFVMSLTNPANILSFVFVFSGFHIDVGGFIASILLVFGIFLGSSLFGVLLSSLGLVLKCEVRSLRFVTWINRATGIVILVFGIAMIANSLIYL